MWSMSLDGNTLIPSTTETSRRNIRHYLTEVTNGPRVDHTICGAAPNEVQYCNHIKGICGTDEVSKANFISGGWNL